MKKNFLPGDSTDAASGLTRRSLLAIGGAAALITTLEWSSPALAGQPTPVGAVPTGLVNGMPAVRLKNFDDGWLFCRGALTGADAPGFADSSWRTVSTPHDWSIEDLPGQTAADGGATADPAAWLTPANAPVRIGPFDSTETTSGGSQAWTVGGEGWYRKHFSASDVKAGERVEIRFDGIYEYSDVWINGNHLGFQAYGYIPIAYDLTPYLSLTGENVISVRVRNIARPVAGTRVRVSCERSPWR
ncbi:sugar-binding domain-containing protein [Subtercola boreus]|uniref:sugar-binding domain-containing protein n=1 Tax=Subtercola boreus TaxID=120213 RepID=UPI001559B4DA|nr:sugar-binding domain-containing protein [Subtercola boreus]